MIIDMSNVAKYILWLKKDLIPKNKRIGVVISGGFDSTILWHTIYGECLENNQVCIPFTVPKVDGAFTYANRMLEWSCKEYGVKQKHTWKIGNVDWYRDQGTDPFQGEEVMNQLRLGIKEILEEDYVDIVFVGTNPYPPNYETLCSYHTPAPRNETNNTPWQDIVKQPFQDLGMTKEQLVLLAREYKILKQVSEITHSCVENIRGRCGECFWCKEREWAFGEVGEVDYGTA